MASVRSHYHRGASLSLTRIHVSCAYHDLSSSIAHFVICIPHNRTEVWCVLHRTVHLEGFFHRTDRKFFVLDTSDRCGHFGVPIDLQSPIEQGAKESGRSRFLPKHIFILDTQQWTSRRSGA